MRTLQQIKSDFEQTLSEVARINGVSVDSAVQVATVILQEYGKYSRCPEIEADNGNGGDAPATDSQRNAMRNLKISFSDNISKAEASKLIESAVSKLRGNGKGSTAARPFALASQIK